MSDLISRRAAISAAIEAVDDWDGGYNLDREERITSALNELPSAQPERSSEIQDILEYLDTVLHPIISPDHWNVYSELHDMISMLPSAQPEITLESAIDYLHSIGWMQSHDKQMYEDGQRHAQPEIIHCRDCKFSYVFELCEGKADRYCRWLRPFFFTRNADMYVKDDDFCSRAERRTDEPD